MNLSTGVVGELTGASKRQLAYWDASGLLKPTGKRTRHRRYTFADVVAAKTIVALRRQGCSLQKVRRAVAYLRKHYPSDATSKALASLTLLTDGSAVYMLTDSKAIMDVVSKQTVLWVVNLGRLITEVSRDARAMPMEWVEPVRVQGRGYRLRIGHDRQSGGYVAQCLELPGAIEQGETADEAIENGRAAIASVLLFIARRKHHKAGVRRRA